MQIVKNNKDVFTDALESSIATALEAIGLQAENYAKMECPVDTGRLRNSITHAQLDNRTEVIGTNVEYAAYVELGTQKTAAQPYLKPAATQHGDEYRAIVLEYLKNG